MTSANFECGADRRRHHRMPVVLDGRYMLPDRSEHACLTIDISPGGIHLKTGTRPNPGDRVVAYIAELGRIEGLVRRSSWDGFALAITATARGREKLTSALTWLGNRADLGFEEVRRNERIVPRRSQVILTLDDRIEHIARIIDLSVSGAAVRATALLPLGCQLHIGQRPAKIVRVIEGGYGIEFAEPLPPDALHYDTEL